MTEPAALPQETLRRLRDGLPLDDETLRAFIRGIADLSLGDAQLGAFAMAIRLRGLDEEQVLALTLAMRDSGECLDWSHAGLDGPVLDKHSTGGVGDFTTLVLGPMLAACGGYLPLLSGRGLGHTGGTLDKLASIPGYRTSVDTRTLREVVRAAGVAIVEAGATLAPADRRLYAVRDVTATVDSIPLITASILAKKLAAGSAALVLDVKCGSGAVYSGIDQAEHLARSLVGIAGRAGLPTSALITCMDQPLAGSVGNALELRAALAYLRGTTTPPRLNALCLALGSELLCHGGLAADADHARARLQQARDSGAAAERFARMVAMLGGPNDLLEREFRHLEQAPLRAPVPAAQAGVVTAVDARALGLAVVALGGGRRVPGQAIDTRVGFDRIVAIGERVTRGQPLAWVHADDAERAEWAVRQARAAIAVGERASASVPLVRARLDGGPAQASGDSSKVLGSNSPMATRSSLPLPPW